MLPKFHTQLLQFQNQVFGIQPSHSLVCFVILVDLHVSHLIFSRDFSTAKLYDPHTTRDMSKSLGVIAATLIISTVFASPLLVAYFILELLI
jgi:hypothetical protein